MVPLLTFVRECLRTLALLAPEFRLLQHVDQLLGHLVVLELLHAVWTVGVADQPRVDATCAEDCLTLCTTCHLDVCHVCAD